MEAALAYPLLRRAVLGVHGFVGAWILLSGVAHTAVVWWRDRAGTLGPKHDAGSLLWVGAGLILAGAVLLSAWPALSRGTYAVTLAALGLFAGVIAAIAASYGF